MAERLFKHSGRSSGGKSRTRRTAGKPEAVEICDAVAFARERLGFQPDEYQMAVLRGGKRGIVKGSRQSGKSAVAAANRDGPRGNLDRPRRRHLCSRFALSGFNEMPGMAGVLLEV